MNATIFRQKSIDRITSPDDLNKYLKVVNPSSWVIIFSVLIILSEFLVWSLTGKIEHKIKIEAKVSKEIAHFVTASNIKSGMHVIVVDTKPTLRDVRIDSEGYFIGSANAPEMYNGIYKAVIVTKKLNEN